MFTRNFIRHFSATIPRCSKSVSSRVIIPPPSHFGGAKEISIREKTEYKQLPDDSNYIEKFYNELEQFSQDFLQKQLNKSYSDFDNDPDELVFELEKYIELQIIPRHSVLTEQPNKSAGSAVSTVYCKTMSDKLVIERFLDFCKGVKLTLRLNGGHSFIFDVLLQSKAVFDQFQREKDRSV